jgi:hypothetical protein
MCRCWVRLDSYGLDDTLTCFVCCSCWSKTSVRSFSTAKNSLIRVAVLRLNFCLWNLYSSKLPQLSFNNNADFDFWSNWCRGELSKRVASD